LQAADLIAWEYYRHCREMAEKGYDTPGGPDITHLAKNMNLDCQFADRESIERVKEFSIDRVSGEDREFMSHHFKTFDPGDLPPAV
jgi:hypothetical protein